ncbi:NAD(P)-binding protein [Serendipita vermifera]|nr:NAD(P)-binding protein [Serendipita vermifera]
MIYSGKTALVTGARGIAEAVVKSLFEKGANVIIVSSSSSCEKLASRVLSLGDDRDDAGGNAVNKAVAIRSDLSSASAAAELAKKAISTAKSEFKNTHGHEGQIDYVILCGGIMPMATLEKVDEKTWEHIFAVNVVGPVFLVKELASHIANDGKILFFSSSLTMASSLPPAYLPYVASKGAIEQTSRALAKDPTLVSRGISSTVISPGPTSTKLFLDGKPQELINNFQNANPYHRLGDVEDIAATVDGILVAGKWLNGANVRANGGSFV